MNAKFQWDDVKADRNCRKHGVDFETASEVFEDVFAVEELDPRIENGEYRYQLIGRGGGKLLTVIYTLRGEIVRIISARQSTRREHERYYRENSQE